MEPFSMDVKSTARRQYIRAADAAAAGASGIKQPSEGWLTTIRKALGMSGADVAARLGQGRNTVYQAERNERNNVITLAQMEKLATAMGCHFVYAIVPDGRIEDVIRKQARQKAEARIRRVSAHMALEQQSLPEPQIQARIEDLAEELVRTMPPDFWDPQ